MKKISKQGQILIQKKIDGVLTAMEEEQFNDLINTSPEARSFYQKVAILHHSLEFNSGHIPGIDLSDQIMEAVNPQKIIRRPFTQNTRHFTSVNHRQILAYAAILIIGVILGSMATYFGTGNVKMPDADEVSGTIAKPAGDGYSFYQGGTGIKVQNYKSGDFRMLIVDIETADTVVCSIGNRQKSDLSQNVKLLFLEGNFQIAKNNENEQNYICHGKNVFLINNVDRLDRGSIRFTRKDKLMYEYQTN